MKKKSPLKLLVILFSVLLLLIGGGIATLYIMFPSQKIIALIVPQVEKALARKVTVENAGITLYPSLGVTISGVRIANTPREGFSKDPFVNINRFSIAVSVLSLFKGYPEITEIVLDRPQLLIESDKTGAGNLDDLAPSDNSAPFSLPALPVPLSLKKFVITNGSLVYDDKKGGSRIIVESVNEEIAIAIDKELKDVKTTGSLVLAQVSVKTGDIKKPLTNLKITLTHNINADLVAGTITVNELRLSLQKIALTLKGSVKKATTPAPILDLAMASDPIQLADILKEIPVELAPMVAKLTAGGVMEVSLAVKGALEQGKQLPVQGKFSIKNGRVKSTDLPEAITDLNIDCSFTDKDLTVKAMKMMLGESPVAIEGTVTNFQDPIVNVQAHADVQLDKIKEILALPAGSSLAGRLKLDVTARGKADPSDPAKLDCKGTADLVNVEALWPPLIKPAVINGTVTLTSKAIGENLRVAIGASSLVMKAEVTNYLTMLLADSTKKQPRPAIDFTVTSPFLNVDEFIKPPVDSPATDAAAADDKNAPLLAPLPGVDVKGAITAGKLVYRGFTMDKVTVKVTEVNNVADVALTTGFSGGSIDNALHADVKNVNNVVFSNKLSVRNVEVNDLMRRFGDYIKPVTPLNRELREINNNLFGRVNIQSSLAGNGKTSDALMKSLAGTITAIMANGKIINTPVQQAAQNSFAQFLKTDKLGSLEVINFKSLAAAIHIADGNAVVDELKILSDAGDWTVKGNVGFDALMNMAVATKLTKEMSARLTGAEGAVKSAVKSAASKYLQGTQYAGATGLLDNVDLVPRDRDGRVTLRFGLGGPVAGPKISGLAFGEGTAGKGAAPAPASRQPSTPQQAVQQKVNQVKQTAQGDLKKSEDAVKQKAKDAMGGLLKR